MLAAIMSLVLAQFAANPTVTGQFDGECRYPPELLARDDHGILVTCNRATVDGGGITFASRSWGSRMRFYGRFEGDRLTVDRVAVRNNAPREARGVCQVYYANEAVSTIACTAVVHGQSYAANFVVSRI